MREKSHERRIFAIVLVLKLCGRRDQLGQIFQPVGAFALGRVVRAQTAALQTLVGQFVQRDRIRRCLQAVDDFQECTDRRCRTAGELRLGDARGGGGIQRNTVALGQLLYQLHRARADAAWRKIHYPRKGAIVIGIAREPQIRKRMFDLLPLEKSQATVDAISHARTEQRVFQHARLRIRAIQQRLVRKRRTAAIQRTDFIDDKSCLVTIGRCRVNAHRFALARIGPQIFAKAIFVVLNDRVGSIENITLRSVVLFQLDDIGTRKVALEIAHVADFGAAEFVNTLVVIADGKHGRTAAREQPDPAILQLIGILKFIDQNELEAFAIVFAQCCVLAE